MTIGIDGNNLGRGQLIERLAERINQHFQRGSDDAVDKSLVIGIFGEWGSGKSWVIERLNDLFVEKEKQRKDKKDGHEDRILTVPFNPWRFEAEAHLIVPLLMTVHDVLKKYDADETAKKGSDYFYRSALAFARAWKFKIGMPGLGSCEFSPDAAMKAQEEWLNDNQKELDSCYYDFENQLNKITKGHLKFLFLIDDIDRCLPERAVQMLEAIKLFLDVPDCAFVLGVDDEVVERGIRYRYREYIQLRRDASSNVTDTRPPITGMEYLEKIIHLPVRLPLMRKSQVADFLTARYPDLFKQPETGGKEISPGRESQFIRPEQSRELLDLFRDAVPMIPRKLIRAAELLKFLIGMSGDRHLDRLLLARLVLLQLFAPEVYRHLRRVNPHLVRVMAKWSEKGILTLSHLDVMEKDNKYNYVDETGQVLTELLLIRKLQKAGKNRMNFDPCKVIKGLTPDSLNDDLVSYFHLLDEQAFPIISENQESLETVSLSDPDLFLDELFSAEEAVWRNALDRDELQGKALDEELFQEVIEKLRPDDSQVNNPAWLSNLALRLTGDNIDELEKRFHLRQKLKTQMGNHNMTIHKRALSAVALGRLGDPRPGVTTRADNPGLPHIDWVEIPGGRFMLGSDDEDLDSQEQPVRQIHVKPFKISRYPITNAQYRCFVTAGSYEKQKYWASVKGSAQWLAGDAADEKLLATVPEKIRDGYRKWLDEDRRRNQPRFWADGKWTHPNHPVVGVSWFEAMAFCAWLSEQEEGLVRLSGEEAWEYAARGAAGLKYAWGNEFDKNMGNTEKTGLGRTSAVGLFPPGKAIGPKPESRPFQLHDMTGNVWEWTASRWGKDFSTPDFMYAGWDESDEGKKEREDSDHLEIRVIRGGSWNNAPDYIRCSVRVRVLPGLRFNGLGFRVVSSLAADS